jgi:hypothetical protein
LQTTEGVQPLSAANEACTQHRAPHWNAWLVSQQAPLPQSSGFVSGHDDPEPQESAAPSARQASSNARGSVIQPLRRGRAASLGKRTTRLFAPSDQVESALD